MKLPYYRWFPTDFAGDARVRFMGWEARAAYRELLDAAWQLGPLPDPVELLGVLGFPNGPELWERVAPCWIESPDGWVHEHLEGERCDALARKERSSKANLVKAMKGTPEGAPEGTSEACAGDTSTPTPPPPPPPPSPSPEPESERVREGALPPPAGAGPPSPPKKKAKRRRKGSQPTIEECTAAFDRRVALAAVPGLGDAVSEWYEALRTAPGRDKRWASARAFEMRLDELEKRPQDAVAALSHCTAECWMRPLHGFERVDEGAGQNGRLNLTEWAPAPEPQYETPNPLDAAEEARAARQAARRVAEGN